MGDIIFKELGFPIVLVDPPMREIRGVMVPDVNMRMLQDSVFRLLVVKPSRHTGSEVRFIRKYLRIRQVDLARTLNQANHSVVSHWEKRGDGEAGMEYNTEVLLRVWMAAKAGLDGELLDLLDRTLKDLAPASSEPMAVPIPHAA
ncbi:MAG: DNA-binding transcriptional regulator YiaG [Myxococcota bacterium]|jgi:DNA-binding transcriptional regulator YiaG